LFYNDRGCVTSFAEVGAMFKQAILKINFSTLIVLVVSGCTNLLHNQLPTFIGAYTDCPKSFAKECKVQRKRQSGLGYESVWIEEFTLPSLLPVSCSARHILDQFSGISFRNLINLVLRE